MIDISSMGVAGTVQTGVVHHGGGRDVAVVALCRSKIVASANPDRSTPPSSDAEITEIYATMDSGISTRDMGWQSPGKSADSLLGD